jgi:hypothetical protein
MRIKPKPQPRRRVRPASWTSTPAAPVGTTQVAPESTGSLDGIGRTGTHPLTRLDENQRLWAYEQRIKDAFARIVPTLKSIAARVPDAGFEDWAQAEARRTLGFELPESRLADAWVAGLDRRALFAHATFETVRAMSDDYFTTDPLDDRGQSDEFRRFLLDCGFHAMNVTPCSDGRLAHAIRYVLRLPMGAVQRRANAGALFDVEEALDRWSSVELGRFREGVPNTADAPTRYLKVVVYHYSSRDPEHHGCAAHGSDTRQAAPPDASVCTPSARRSRTATAAAPRSRACSSASTPTPTGCVCTCPTHAAMPTWTVSSTPARSIARPRGSTPRRRAP